MSKESINNLLKISNLSRSRQGQESKEGSILKRRQQQRENSRDLHTCPLDYSSGYRSVHVCEETTKGCENNQLKGLEEMIFRVHTRLEIVNVFQTRKPHNSWGYWEEYLERPCQGSGTKKKKKRSRTKYCSVST